MCGFERCPLFTGHRHYTVHYYENKIDVTQKATLDAKGLYRTTELGHRMVPRPLPLSLTQPSSADIPLRKFAP